MSCGLGHRCGLDPSLLWLWCTLAATALIRPLAWKTPYATGAAQKRTKDKKKKKKKRKKKMNTIFPFLEKTGIKGLVGVPIVVQRK